MSVVTQEHVFICGYVWESICSEYMHTCHVKVFVLKQIN